MNVRSVLLSKSSRLLLSRTTRAGQVRQFSAFRSVHFSDNKKTEVEATSPSEQPSTEAAITTPKPGAYNGIPFHSPPKTFTKKLSFFGVLIRYTFYFVFGIWIFSGYPIYYVATAVGRFIHGAPEEVPEDEE